jgi:hypothetical protein
LPIYVSNISQPARDRAFSFAFWFQRSLRLSPDKNRGNLI